jgi:hypothetical protein
MMNLTGVICGLFLLSLIEGAHAEGACNPDRVDYVGSCAGSVDCLNVTFNKLDKQVSERVSGLKGGAKGSENSQATALLRKSYGLEEGYRKTFCAGIVHGATEFWSAQENRPVSAQSGLSPDQQHQLSFIAAKCNVTLLGEFLYQLTRQYCSEE